jgi:hypothetical protein
VLAGNAHLGAPSHRLTATLLPTWRYAALTEPLGDRLAEVIAFQGSVMDTHGIDHFRVVQGDRLLWCSRKRHGRAIRDVMRSAFKTASQRFSKARARDCCRKLERHVRPDRARDASDRRGSAGLWILSGFGRQGLNTTAMGGQLLARSILAGDDRWRLFSPFELVWAGERPDALRGRRSTSGRAAIPPPPVRCRGSGSARAIGTGTGICEGGAARFSQGAGFDCAAACVCGHARRPARAGRLTVNNAGSPGLLR